MQVDIKGVSQDISCEDGSSTYSLIIQLPTGAIVRAVITEDSAKLVLSQLVPRSTASPTIRDTPPHPEVDSYPVEDPEYPQAAMVFGGDSSTPQPPPTNVHPTAGVVAHARQVAQDSMGYPVLSGEHYSAEDSTVGELDEEGVGQV